MPEEKQPNAALDSNAPARQPVAKIEHTRSEDFAQVYANNVFYESTAWDLKMIFGITEQALGPNAVVQHTAVTLSWAQVKLMIFLLRLHVLTHEARTGRVSLLPGLVQPIPVEPPENVRAFFGIDGATIETYHKARKLYEEFIAENPEVEPNEKTRDSKDGKPH